MSSKKEIFQNIIRNKKILLAPLTKGGNLPFRRLCTEDFGTPITCSEMIIARNILKSSSRVYEKALVRKHTSEKVFGVQLAVRQVDEAVDAVKKVLELSEEYNNTNDDSDSNFTSSGVSFIDINCGCPKEEFTRRGLGASLLKRQRHIGNLVDAITNAVPDTPVTVKIRLGWGSNDNKSIQIGKIVEEAGAAALAIHGRTRTQHYSKKADWNAIRAVKEELTIPVIGNGDIYTYTEANYYLAEGYADGIMIGRGALNKPWIFKEICRDKETWDISPMERIDILMKFVSYLKEYFGDDNIGHKRILNFLPWHLNNFARYRFIDDDRLRNFDPKSNEVPFIHQRNDENGTNYNSTNNSTSSLLPPSNLDNHHCQILQQILSCNDPKLLLKLSNKLLICNNNDNHAEITSYMKTELHNEFF